MFSWMELMSFGLVTWVTGAIVGVLIVMIHGVEPNRKECDDDL